jgi:hypothetical protein
MTVAAPAGCPWTSSSQASWLAVIGGATGSGAGVVTFSVAANSGASRHGTLTIGGEVVTVSQAGNCTVTVSPASATVPVSGGTVVLDVSAGPGCDWTAVPGASWLAINSGASGSGSGTVIVQADANAGPARASAIVIAGQTVTVTQASGCAFTVAPTVFTQNYLLAVGLTIQVTAGGGCGWTAVSHDPWIDVTSGAAGVGAGTVVFSVGLNLGASRTGSLTVAGTTVTVHQDRLRLLP